MRKHSVNDADIERAISVAAATYSATVFIRVVLRQMDHKAAPVSRTSALEKKSTKIIFTPREILTPAPVVVDSSYDSAAECFGDCSCL